MCARTSPARTDSTKCCLECHAPESSLAWDCLSEFCRRMLSQANVRSVSKALLLLVQAYVAARLPLRDQALPRPLQVKSVPGAAQSWRRRPWPQGCQPPGRQGSSGCAHRRCARRRPCRVAPHGARPAAAPLGGACSAPRTRGGPRRRPRQRRAAPASARSAPRTLHGPQAA